MHRYASAFGWIVLLLFLLGGCASSQPYTLGPVKTDDPDRQPIEPPEEVIENQYWDRIDMSVFYQLQKPLNLAWVGRGVGKTLGVAEADEADNVNVMDEPPNSSWWQRRIFYRDLSLEAMAVGPNDRDTTGVAAGPDTSGTWTVVSGKFEGAARGFQIKDPRGDRYLIKLDGPKWPEQTTSAEVISTKIFHAAGYNVPQNTITYFDPQQLEVGAEATVQDGNTERPMTPEDITTLLEPYERRADGTLRGMASKFVDGRPLGPFEFRGTRDGDPNDRVRHEQRRELRGHRVLGSWLNDADRRAANTLAVYTDEQYVKHYLIDMGSTLGANASSPHRPVHGQAYIIDQRKIPQALLSFGSYRFPWWHVDPTPTYTAVGYFRSELFKPGDWVMSYPNPAHEKMTRRDAYWGAKIVMSFSDAAIRRIVETGRISNPEAEDYLVQTLIERRDEIGRYWFDRINPLDRFAVRTDAVARGASVRPVNALLAFDDLAVTTGLAEGGRRRYTMRFVHDDDPLGPERTTDASSVPLAVDGTPLSTLLDERGVTDRENRVVRVDLRTVADTSLSRARRASWAWSGNDGSVSGSWFLVRFWIQPKMNTGAGQ
jgi:hypothetical protein